MSDLIKPKTITLTDIDGVEHSYIISRINALDGKEIASKYVWTLGPKIGNYQEHREVAEKMLSYAAVEKNGVVIRLTTPTLISNHVPDWETLVQLEKEMIFYNTSFFLREKVLNFLKGVLEIVERKVSATSTECLAPSSQKEKPPFTN